ncbi:MAG: hypothetical protein ACFFAN_06920 [Promethearchaeota archaeon]
MLKSEVEAEELEKAAKDNIKNKNYKSAISFFEKAKDIYIQLNFKGKISFIEKQLAQLRRAIEYEKGKRIVKVPVVEKNNFEVDAQRKKVEHLSKKAFEIKKSAIMDERDLSLADIRRAKLREIIEEGEKKAEIERIRDAKIHVREEQRKKIFKEREEELKNVEETKKEEENLKDKADWAMEQAKMAIKYKKFKDARKYYKEAIDLMKNLGWFDQVSILYQEIKNIEKYEFDYLRKLKQNSFERERIEEQFQKSVNEIIAVKKDEDQKKLEILKTLPPEIKRILEKAQLLKEKALKDKNTNNFQRALGRYQYILELYKSIPVDKIDLTSDILEIEKKIAELEAKV